MSSTKKPKNTKKNVASKEPPKREISKFGKMIGSSKGKIKEIGNVWDF